MTQIDKILTEWSFRCDKGYPDIDNPEDIRILREVMAEMNIELPTETVLIESTINTKNIEPQVNETDEFYDLNKIFE